MNKKQQLAISEKVEGWISEEDMPAPAYVKPLRRFNRLYYEDEYENGAYKDFMHWALTAEHAVLKSVPIKEEADEFWKIPFAEFERPESAFNTVDFQRQSPFTFDRGAYRLRKILEVVKDLAIRHSCISQEEGRCGVHGKFASLVEREFGEKARAVAGAIRCDYPELEKYRLKRALAVLHKHLRECNEIWKQYSIWP